ncbi:DUF2798 domain-containing protein [Pontibacter qinzhouensis]|uniref:DUF2798 domain-containing protein n=1 Tax=Pontibacter qinzhouensis TaxID=2603253 RepID=A0A5C8IZU9_9BACT|nr:DUF2798 domain-containing protein [Pontibacter qinzhouensis]TXK26425.1 DUF2798 domain-containing protein [Pontibacter qinzhouensis]
MKKSVTPQKLKVKLLVILILSLLLASAMELYTFGLPSDFFTRWFRSFFVLFILIAGTVLGIVPGVNYVVNKLKDLVS